MAITRRAGVAPQSRAIGRAAAADAVPAPSAARPLALLLLRLLHVWLSFFRSARLRFTAPATSLNRRRLEAKSPRNYLTERAPPPGQQDYERQRVLIESPLSVLSRRKQVASQNHLQRQVWHRKCVLRIGLETHGMSCRVGGARVVEWTSQCICRIIERYCVATDLAIHCLRKTGILPAVVA